MFRFGPLLGAEQLGATVYELPPGQAICPYHYEYAEEEWLLVLEGRPTLRRPDGEEDACAVGRRLLLPPVRQAPTSVRNETDAPVRVLMWSPGAAPGRPHRVPRQWQDRRLDGQSRR